MVLRTRLHVTHMQVVATRTGRYMFRFILSGCWLFLFFFRMIHYLFRGVQRNNGVDGWHLWIALGVLHVLF